MSDENGTSEEMAEELVDALDEGADVEDDVGDGLTQRERHIQSSRERERLKKAQELRKQLRKRQLGILKYKWPAVLLILAGILSISTEFLQIMTRDEAVPTEVGFYNFFEAFQKTLGAIYLFPLIAGGIMIILSYYAYTRPKWTWLALIPALMMLMSGGTVYFLITFAVTADPSLTDHIYATGVPLSMFIAALVAFIAIWMRERE
jgi:ATP/ADP translocase